MDEQYVRSLTRFALQSVVLEMAERGVGEFTLIPQAEGFAAVVRGHGASGLDFGDENGTRLEEIAGTQKVFTFDRCSFAAIERHFREAIDAEQPHPLGQYGCRDYKAFFRKPFMNYELSYYVVCRPWKRRIDFYLYFSMERLLQAMGSGEKQAKRR